MCSWVAKNENPGSQISTIVEIFGAIGLPIGNCSGSTIVDLAGLGENEHDRA